MKITQSAAAELLAARMGITATQAKVFVDQFKVFVYEQLSLGNEVELSGFGVFSVSHRAPRLGVNPRQPTQRITIPELNTPKFRAGEAFKEAVKLK